MTDNPGSGRLIDFLIARELGEVYLLIDNVTTVRSKAMPTPPPDTKLFNADDNWIEQICRIGWPLDATTEANEARMAAQLIVAKDLLNAAAAPATGASIAFTTLMVGEGDGNQQSSILSKFFKWIRQYIRHSEQGSEPVAGQASNNDNSVQRPPSLSTWPPSRESLAALAYPHYVRVVWIYRAVWLLLLALSVAWLAFTSLFSWDVATGSILLSRANELHGQLVTPAPATTRTSGAAASTTPRTSAESQADRQASYRYQLALNNLQQWMDHPPWPRRAIAPLIGGTSIASNFPETIVPASTPGGSGPVLNLEWAGVFIGILAGTILPLCYGILGAAAAVVRGISLKMREYTFMPRDLALAYIQLALGALIGACIGLFVNSDGGQSGEGGLIATAHLSQSALCFLAGFGVEGVFRALEDFVRRVFNLDRDRVVPPAKT